MCITSALARCASPPALARCASTLELARGAPPLARQSSAAKPRIHGAPRLWTAIAHGPRFRPAPSSRTYHETTMLARILCRGRSRTGTRDAPGQPSQAQLPCQERSRADTRDAQGLRVPCFAAQQDAKDAFLRDSPRPSSTWKRMSSPQLVYGD